MRKILISILAGMSLTGSALAYELVHIRDLKVGVHGNTTWYEDRLGYMVCMTQKVRDDWKTVTGKIPVVKTYRRSVIESLNNLDPMCHFYIADEESPKVVAEEIIPEIPNRKNDERVCTRIEGCEVDLNAVTPEEYCPTCVWKSELKKIKIIEYI